MRLLAKEGYYTSYLASYSDSSSEEEHDIPLVNTSIPDDEIVDGHYHWETESSSFEVEVQNPGFYNIYWIIKQVLILTFRLAYQLK